ncbi:MAG: flagellin, partial [Firmicutes bacterium]|nr:flagellin [Bacillota bacterium]
MALMVNKNIGAMQAHGYLKQTENAFSKAVEKLSSGMKINRAADDPAGLVISEKYRAQVDGLKQAIKNSQDGISLVQTAEASLDETTTVLRTMRNLALHAASTGTSDSEAVAADQAQIAKSIQTLDRIANTTSFGNRKLLDGSSGVAGTTTDSSVSFISGS